MTTILRSQELTCPSCVSTIETTLKRTDGVQDAAVHFNTGRIEVRHDPDRVSEADLVRLVQQAGYETEVSVF